MRLICPNCDAQYEVPDEVMPPDGRDVQCSNCGHTWFQVHPDHAEASEEDAPDDDDVSVDDTSPSDIDDDLDGQEMTIAPDETEEETYEEETLKDTEDAPAPPSAQQPRGVDPAVADILREEAAREARARAEEQESLETQPDLGLGEPADDEATRRAREARSRMAKIRGEFLTDEDDYDEEPDATDAAIAATVAMGSRRDLLPDIEEINSTLRSQSDRQGMADSSARDSGEEMPQQVRRGGFRRGFTLTILLFALLALAYAYAPRIAASVPQAAPVLEKYVASVDTARLWLDRQVRGWLQQLDDAAANADR